MIAAESGPRPARDFINYVPTSRPGALAPHAWLHDGSSLYDHFGQGYTLLAASASLDDIAAARADARRAGVPLTVIQPAEGAIASLYPARLTLIRPDQHVAWRGDAWPGGACWPERAPYHFTHNEAHSPTQEARGDNHAAKRRHSGATQAVALFRNRCCRCCSRATCSMTAPISAMPSCRWAPTWTFRWPPTAWARACFLRLRQRLRAGQPRAAALRRPALAGFHVPGLGLVSCLMAALQGVKSFYVLRFLLGRRGRLHPRRELLPGIVDSAAFSQSDQRGVHHGAAGHDIRRPAGRRAEDRPGMQGWRWLFLLEGLPTVLLGLLILRLLPAARGSPLAERRAAARPARRDGGRGRAAPAGREPCRVPPALAVGPLADPPERLCGHLRAGVLPADHPEEPVRHHAAGNRRAADDPERGGAGLQLCGRAQQRTQRRHPLAPGRGLFDRQRRLLLLPVAATVSLALFLAAVSIITGYTIATTGR